MLNLHTKICFKNIKYLKWGIPWKLCRENCPMGLWFVHNLSTSKIGGLVAPMSIIGQASLLVHVIYIL